MTKRQTAGAGWLAVALAVSAFSPSFIPSFILGAHAELGPCKPDGHALLLCGSGKGAARVIADTVSPDNRFALAWRDPDSEPDAVTEGDNEMLLIRLADGAVLAKAPTSYFRNPATSAPRVSETATWSADSRRVVRRYNTRYSTDTLTLYRIGADGALAGETDLLAILDPAVRARLKRPGRNPRDYWLSADTDGRTLGSGDVLRFNVMMTIVKQETEVDYKVTMRVTPRRDGARARLIWIRQTHEQ